MPNKVIRRPRSLLDPPGVGDDDDSQAAAWSDWPLGDPPAKDSLCGISVAGAEPSDSSEKPRTQDNLSSLGPKQLPVAAQAAQPEWMAATAAAAKAALSGAAGRLPLSFAAAPLWKIGGLLRRAYSLPRRVATAYVPLGRQLYLQAAPVGLQLSRVSLTLAECCQNPSPKNAHCHLAAPTVSHSPRHIQVLRRGVSVECSFAGRSISLPTFGTALNMCWVAQGGKGQDGRDSPTEAPVDPLHYSFEDVAEAMGVALARGRVSLCPPAHRLPAYRARVLQILYSSLGQPLPFLMD